MESAARARRRTPGPRDARVLLVLGVVYALACVAGRETLVPGARVSLVWPAAGVSVLWLVARARRPWPWLDWVLLASITAAAVLVTGASPGTALVGGVAATLQAVLCVLVVARYAPRLWAARGYRQLDRVTELWWLVFGAAAGALASAPLAQLAVALTGQGTTWETALLWSARNTVSILTIGLLGWTVGGALHDRHLPRAARGGPGWWADGHRLDVLGALLFAPAAYVLWFLSQWELAVVFPLIAFTVWAGSRLPTSAVVVHTSLCGSVVVVMTLAGSGPMANLPDPGLQVGVAQLYVGLLTVIGMALALAGEERRRLVGALSVARDRAQAQAALLTSVLETMSEGVRVVDAGGRVVVRNPTAARLLTGRVDLDPGDSRTDLAGLTRLDGSALRDEELPFRRALVEGRVRDVDLMVRTPGVPQPRVVTFSATRIPDGAGGGVVTVLRDVTEERAELRRAATVQASLLPARAPDLPGFEVAARFVPAGSVGGDFYDWERVGGGLVITLADVMGKGPGAAILAATTRSLLRAQPVPEDVAATLSGAERALDADLVNAGAFVTMFRGFLDPSTGDLTYADAGHGLSLVVRPDGSLRRLPATGLPLGIAAGPERVGARTRLLPGDVLVTFSDGLLDVLGGSIGDLERVREVVRGAATADGAAAAVLALAGGAEDAGDAEDDLTVLVVRRLPGLAPAGVPHPRESGDGPA